MKRTKPRAVWLGRMGDPVWPMYEIGTSRRYWTAADGFRDGALKRFCVKDFERFAGITLDPGECVKVRIVVEEA